LQNAGFKEIFIQPASGDSGGSLGAALAIYHNALNQPRKYIMKHGYYGAEYNNKEIEKFLKENNIVYEKYDNEQDLLNVVANNIIAGKVIGWFQGRFEWGPRALGNRSIIADARRADMKDIVNTKIKFREPYRPFAPSVLVEYASDWFEISEAEKHYPARFMLYVVDIKKDKQKLIPAITHIDGTGRLQTVFKEENPRYWNLINNFYQKTGVPLILNTSFNLKGEPIVTSPIDAYSTFVRSGIDILVLGNYIIIK